MVFSLPPALTNAAADQAQRLRALFALGPELADAVVYVALYPSGSSLTLRERLPRDAPRSPTALCRVCVFCRRDQRRASREAAASAAAATALPPDAESTWRWEPDADRPCSSDEAGSGDDDATQHTFAFAEMHGALS